MQKNVTLYNLRQAWISFLFLLLFQNCAFSQAENRKVCITRTGEKYHTRTCRYLRYSSYEISIREARKRGYTPCSVCKPGNETVIADSVRQENPPQQHVSPPRQAPKEQQTTVQQCAARTKSGTRCKRTTTNTNGRCWQHQ